MKQFKLSSKRQASGQVVVLLIIVLALLGGAWWWLNSNKENAAREGTAFARDAIQKIAVQHDVNFFNSRLSPQARMNFPASTQQEFVSKIVKLGAPVRPVDVQGKIEFNFAILRAAQALSIRGYIIQRDTPMRTSRSRTPSAVGRLTRSHSYPRSSSPDLDLHPRVHLRLQLRLHRKLRLHLQASLHRNLHLHLQVHLDLDAKRSQHCASTGKRLQQQTLERIQTNLRPRLHGFAAREQFVLRKKKRPVIICSHFSTFGSASLNT